MTELEEARLLHQSAMQANFQMRAGIHATIAKLERAADRLDKASKQTLNQPPGSNFIQGNVGAAHMASQAAALLRELVS